jgi:hypothetical protein
MMRGVAQSKIIGALLLCLLLTAIQLQWRTNVPQVGVLILAALAVFPLLLSFFDLVLVTLFSFWLLRWQPFVGVEFLVALMLPFLFFMTKRFILVRLWVAAAVFSVLEVVVFYGALFTGSEWHEVQETLKGSLATVMLPSIALNCMVSLLIFFLFRYVYQTES